jgi:hypothetical protein
MENQPKPASGKMESKSPELYVRNMSMSLSYYEMSMIRDGLNQDIRSLQGMIESVTEDAIKFDLLEMKLRRAELLERFAAAMAF